jgi:HAD superfamily phosphatase (TIGR01668 family)
VPEDVLAWVSRLGELGLRACLLSNNWHKTVFRYAKQLAIPLVYKAMKPLPFAYLRALRKVKRKKGEKVLAVGDQLMTDVVGAHILGFEAILVPPQATKDLWHTLFLRRLERLLMGDLKPHD